MNGPFAAAYAAAFRGYLLDPGEPTLHLAYELGREAVGQGLSVLDVTVAHHEALVSALSAVSGAAEAQAVTSEASAFFLESLSAYEMVQRGFSEALETARLERRHTELSRQLQSFLADASLALDASDSLPEMLQLVAEQARELIGADCCLVTVAVDGRPRVAEAASYAEDDRRWTTLVQWLDLFAVYELIRAGGGSLRIAGEQLVRLSPFAGSDRPLRGWLAASLTTLDGSELGAIQLFDKRDGGFTADDEAALLHLALMASAAVERARSYQARA